MLLAKENYAFQDILESAARYQTFANITGDNQLILFNILLYSSYVFIVTPDSIFGIHGYDPNMPAMRPFFMVRGPKIRKNHMVTPFNFVDLYNFFADILQVKSVPNDGTRHISQEILVMSGVSGITSIVIISSKIFSIYYFVMRSIFEQPCAYIVHASMGELGYWQVYRPLTF